MIAIHFFAVMNFEILVVYSLFFVTVLYAFVL